MIYFLLLCTLILLTIVQSAFFFSLRNPDKIVSYLSLPKKSKLPLIIFGISTLIFFFIVFLLLKKLSTPQPFVASPGVHISLPPGVQKLSHTSFSTGETYYFLYTLSDKSQETAQAVSVQIKESVCTKLCTINLYDDVRAYRTDQERLTITVDKTMQEWNEKNYVSVANHYIGYLSSAPYSTFAYYPYKDWYYRQHLSK
jgi:hypothetical protein